MPDNKPRLRILKLICVAALIAYISTSGLICSADSSPERSNHKYDIQNLQALAIQRSEELKLLDQAIKVAESKRWTSVMPSIAVGNNFVSKNADPRFSVGWDVAEVLGGGRIRQVNLEIARLKFQRIDLERKLKIQVLENVLALERAERNAQRIQSKLSLLRKKIRVVNDEYEHGERDFDGVIKYWDIEEDLEAERLKAEDEIILEKAKLEQLVGEI